MRSEPIWPLVMSRQILSLLVVKVGTMSITGELLQTPPSMGCTDNTTYAVHAIHACLN